MKNAAFCSLAFLSVLLAGCLQLEDRLTLNADGSGRWQIKIVMPTQQKSVKTKQMTLKSSNSVIAIESTLRETLAKLKGVTVLSYEQKTNDADVTITADVKFASIVELYRDPEISRQLLWTFRKVNDDLLVSAERSQHSPDIDQLPSGLEFDTIKSLMMGLKIDRTLILPNPITATNAEEHGKHHARWLFEITKDTTHEQFAERGRNVPRASCSLSGIRFPLPLTPAVNEKQ